MSQEENTEIFRDTVNKYKIYEKDIDNSINNQVFISEKEDVPYYNVKKRGEVLVSTSSTIEAAEKYRGKKVAILNFASATRPGGGVLKGSSAQEECICRCTTLYPCITTEKIYKQFYRPHIDFGNNIHNDDIIYTKDVLVIKNDKYEDIEPFKTDVITCAAPNLRTRNNAYNTENTFVTLTDAQLYDVQLKRINRIFNVASYYNADVIIVGAFGCGAFRNNPKVVATAFNKALEDFRIHFDTVEFAIYCKGNPDTDENYQTFKSFFEKK